MDSDGKGGHDVTSFSLRFDPSILNGKQPFVLATKAACFFAKKSENSLHQMTNLSGGLCYDTEEEVKVMEHTLYLDVYFLVNFLCNSLILRLSMHPYRLSGRRIAAAGALGALGACLWELLALGEWLRLFTALALAALMVGVCLGRRPLKQYGRHLVVLYVYGFLLAGVIPFISRYFSLWLIAVVLSYGMLKAALQWIKQKEKLVDVELVLGKGKQRVCLHMKGLIDTGHSLKEPITQKPVLIMRQESLPVKPKQTMPIYYQTVQGDGIMEGIWPISVQVDQMVFKNREIVIGLAKDWKAEGYQVLVPAYLWTDGKELIA